MEVIRRTDRVGIDPVMRVTSEVSTTTRDAQQPASPEAATTSADGLRKLLDRLGQPSRIGESADTPVDQTRLEDAVARLNKAMSALDVQLEFEVRSGHRIIVRVLDARTKEVIREIPPTAVLDVVEGLRRLVGLLVDEVA